MISVPAWGLDPSAPLRERCAQICCRQHLLGVEFPSARLDIGGSSRNRSNQKQCKELGVCLQPGNTAYSTYAPNTLQRLFFASVKLQDGIQASHFHVHADLFRQVAKPDAVAGLPDGEMAANQTAELGRVYVWETAKVDQDLHVSRKYELDRKSTRLNSSH